MTCVYSARGTVTAHYLLLGRYLPLESDVRIEVTVRTTLKLMILSEQHKRMA